MTPTDLLLPACDLAAILVLTLVVYFPRHRRRDLVIAFVAVNVGVLGVATALSSTTVTVGLGMGLFGVLSIIRLRSAELGQPEIAYYFVSLALGLVGGLGVDRGTALALMVLLVVAMAVVDSSWVLPGYRQRVVVLDRAYAGEAELLARLAELLDGRIYRAKVLELDLVDDKTTVDVRYRIDRVTSGSTQGETPLPEAAIR